DGGGVLRLRPSSEQDEGCDGDGGEAEREHRFHGRRGRGDGYGAYNARGSKGRARTQREAAPPGGLVSGGAAGRGGGRGPSGGLLLLAHLDVAGVGGVAVARGLLAAGLRAAADLDPPRLARLGLGDVHREHAVLERRLDVVGVDGGVELEGAEEPAVGPLDAVEAAVLLLARRLPFTADGEGVALHRHLDVLGGDAGEVEGEDPG